MTPSQSSSRCTPLSPNASASVWPLAKRSLAVRRQADRFYMQRRGVKDIDAKMTNSVMRGTLDYDPLLRRDFLS